MKERKFWIKKEKEAKKKNKEIIDLKKNRKKMRKIV